MTIVTKIHQALLSAVLVSEYLHLKKLLPEDTYSPVYSDTVQQVFCTAHFLVEQQFNSPAVKNMQPFVETRISLFWVVLRQPRTASATYQPSLLGCSSPSFLDKLTVHVAKNFLELPKIKVPLILGIWGGKGQGKTFQCTLAYKKLGINPVVMSAGELESGNAGEPAKLIRQRYR